MCQFASADAASHQNLSINQQSAGPRKPWRSVAAVVGALLVTFALTTAVDLLLHALAIFPAFGVRMADSLFCLALSYRIVLNTLGSYLAARWAPYAGRGHALALGGIGVLLATVGAIAMGKFGPGWYSLANIVIALPCAWAGGRLWAASWAIRT